MKGDFTRWTFTPSKHYSSVLLQQGRVLMDADWNEQRDILLAARRRLAVDLIGQAAGPQGDVGFGLTPGEGGLVLGKGRYYVDGIHCELHDHTPLSAQPELPGFDPLDGLPEGRYLVYLDVWERHVTHVEDADIKEKALGGPDHTTRTQVVAQVRLLALEGEAADEDECGRVYDPQELTLLVEGSRGRLAAAVDPPSTASGPCVVAPSAGYRGLENQLYRVEIHKGGSDGSVTFKWCRDNGSVVTAWEGPTGPTPEPEVIEVADLGPDGERTFADPEILVELLDDTHQLLPGPGLLARVDSADEAARTLTLTQPMDADLGDLPTTEIVRGLDEHHPRVRRWLGCKRIDAEGIEDGAPCWIQLEEGIRVRFDLSEGGRFRSGDWWLIPARTVDGSVEWDPDEAQLPHGHDHHYAYLGRVRKVGAETWEILDSGQRSFPSADTLVRLRYVGGDGQQAVLTQPATILPRPLQVQVLNGTEAVAGARVLFRFATAAGDALLTDEESGASGQEIIAIADDDGLIRVRWTLASETAWQSDHTLADQVVHAVLLGDCGEETAQIVQFSTHEPQAREVRHDNTACAAMAKLHESGFDTSDVQGALEVLCANPHLSYVSGDGQEAMPGQELPNDLILRVGNGTWPMEGARVEFTLVDLDHIDVEPHQAADEAWAGSLVVVGSPTVDATWPSGNPRKITVQTGSQGYVRVRWRLGTTPGTQRPGLRASLVPAHSPIPFDSFGPGAVVLFQGTWDTGRTLYYVGGTGQAAEAGQPLPAPLVVRVANEGVPIEGAAVRFTIHDISGASVALDEATGGALTGGAPLLEASQPWSSSSGVQSMRVRTGPDGRARVHWTYPVDQGEGLPGVTAVLLDDELSPTTSLIRFGAALQQPSVEEEEGVHVEKTSMVDLQGNERVLRNDAVVDPVHLLAGIRVSCDGPLDLASLARKRTVHLRPQVPYGWPPYARGSVQSHYHPDLTVQGVQHYDEHVLAGTEGVEEQAITWTPTTAACRMLVGTGPGPMASLQGYFILLPQDWPLPVRVALFGGGERLVRTTLTVEGDFVTGTETTGGLHVDGETLGAPGASGLIDLDYPSGDGRAGGDFRTWFWLDSRLWGDTTTPPVSEDGDGWTGHVAVTGHQPSLGVPPSLIAAWGMRSALQVAHFADGTWTPIGSAGSSVTKEQPGLWGRVTDKGAATAFLTWRERGRTPRLAQVQTGAVTPIDLDDGSGGSVPQAASGPRGVDHQGREALAWHTRGGGLVALTREADGKWSLARLEQTLERDVRERLTRSILSLRASGSSSVARRKELATLTDRLARSLGLDESRRTVLSERVLALLEGSQEREVLDKELAETIGDSNLQFGGRPVIASSGGLLHVLTAATREEVKTLYAFTRSAVGVWSGAELDEVVPGSRLPASTDLQGAGNGDGTVGLVWLTRKDVPTALRWRQDRGWELDKVDVDLSLDPKRPPIVVVDEVGLLHVLMASTEGRLLDAWSDAPGQWTLTDVTYRTGSVAHSTLAASLTAERYFVLVVGAGLSDGALRINPAWFGPPAVEFAAPGGQPTATTAGPHRTFSTHLTSVFRHA